MNTRSFNNFVRTLNNDLNWISRIVIAGLLVMFMTGRTTVAEVQFYTVRAAVDLFDLYMAFYTWVWSWVTPDNIWLAVVILFLVGLVYHGIKAITNAIRGRKKSPVNSAVLLTE